MSITSRCTECEAVTVDGVLTHLKTCAAAKPNTTTAESRMPAIAMTFDNPEEQAEWQRKLGISAGANAKPLESKLSNPTNNDSPDELALEKTDVRSDTKPTDQKPVTWARAKRLVCFFTGHDNATETPGTFLIKCRRCGLDTPRMWFRRTRTLPWRTARGLVWLANWIEKFRDYPGGYSPVYRRIDQQIEGIGTKHSCAAYSYEHLQSTIKQYKADGLPVPTLEEFLSEDGWIDLDEHPEMAREVIDSLNKSLTLEETRREQEELNRHD